MTNSYLKFLKKRIDKPYDCTKFYTLLSKGSITISCFFIKKHVTQNLSLRDTFEISGVCRAHSIYDSSTLFLGYMFESPKKNTVVNPIMLSIKIPPAQDSYEEIILPPKFGVLAFKSSNSSTLILAQDELDLPYIIKDVQN